MLLDESLVIGGQQAVIQGHNSSLNRLHRGTKERMVNFTEGTIESGGTSLVAQWLRIRLPMHGTQVRALVQEDPTCPRATKPVHHNY